MLRVTGFLWDDGRVVVGPFFRRAITFFITIPGGQKKKWEGGFLFFLFLLFRIVAIRALILEDRRATPPLKMSRLAQEVSFTLVGLTGLADTIVCWQLSLLV